MAYDEDLADRIRALLVWRADVSEKAMFGGLAFLVGGNMAVAASGEGGLLVRADPDTSDALLERPGARPMVMRGREMRGWLRVEIAAVAGDDELRRWVDVGVVYAGSLPAKR